MSDRILFYFNTSWRLEYDSQQWILCRGKPGSATWRYDSFIGGYKRTMLRVLKERSEEPITPEGMAAYDSLPETFLEWRKQNAPSPEDPLTARFADSGGGDTRNGRLANQRASSWHEDPFCRGF